jgi:hypothetical protein
VVVGGNADTLPAVTWGGTALTKINSMQTSSTAAIAIYTLLNPTPGTQSLAIAWSGTIPTATTQEIYGHMIPGQDDEAARRWDEFQKQYGGLREESSKLV